MTNKLEKKTAGGCIVSLMMFFGMGSALAQDDPGFDTLSDPFTDLTAEELADFEAGLLVFEHAFGPPQGGGGAPPAGGGPPVGGVTAPLSPPQAAMSAMPDIKVTILMPAF